MILIAKKELLELTPKIYKLINTHEGEHQENHRNARKLLNILTGKILSSKEVEVVDINDLWDKYSESEDFDNIVFSEYLTKFNYQLIKTKE